MINTVSLSCPTNLYRCIYYFNSFKYIICLFLKIQEGPYNVSPLKCIPTPIYEMIIELMEYDPEKRIQLTGCYDRLRGYLSEQHENGTLY